MRDSDAQEEAGEQPAARPGKRQAATIEKILQGAVRALHLRGVNKLQFSEICAYAGVSRGTLYRHFPTKDDLLIALARHQFAVFERELRAALAAQSDPKRRLHAAVVFLNTYVEHQQLDLSFEIEPRFVLQSLRRNYVHYEAAVEQELEPVFRAIEAEAGPGLNRRLCTDFLMRNAYSAALLPGGTAWLDQDQAPDRLWRVVVALGTGS